MVSIILSIVLSLLGWFILYGCFRLIREVYRGKFNS